DSITKDSLVEDIVEEIIDNLIEITDESLASLKEYIDGDYRSGINQLFDTLKGVVVASRYRFEELTRIIRLAQREINEKVDELMDWKNEASQSFLLGSSVDAAKEMILELHPNRQVNIEFQDINKKFIKGEHFRKFVMIFLILIDNAVVHTKEEEVASLSVNVDSKDNFIMLTIANKIDPDDNRISVEKIKVINEKINLAYIDDANKESGSGLFKIKKVISNDIKVDNIIELELTGLDFSVAIRMDEGGIFDEIY
ncbi:GHKL domain-containing protein, partial [Vibrio cholerae]|nr:GHKL domain-containing protein [Vibrio cholerae]